MLYIQYQHQFMSRQAGIAQLEHTLTSAVKLYSMHPEVFSATEGQVDVFQDGLGMVSYNRIPYGVYELLYVETAFKNHAQSRVALMGEAYGSGNRIALYMPDSKKYLSVSGDSEVRGTCFIPELGLRAGHIEGHGFRGYLEKRSSHIFPSKKSLPLPAKGLLGQIDDFVAGDADYQVLSAADLKEQSGLFASFYEPGKSFILPPGAGQINDLVLKGNIMVRCEDEITVSATTTMDMPILVARKIIISNQFKGSLQAFATDTLIVGEHVHLQYPSALVVKGAKSGLLHVGKQTKIEGAVIGYNNKTREDNFVQVRIANGSTVSGQLYCNGKTELKGTINGTCASALFNLKTDMAFYENHLLDARLNSEELPADFACVPLVDDYTEQQFIQWLR